MNFKNIEKEGFWKNMQNIHTFIAFRGGFVIGLKELYYCDACGNVLGAVYIGAPALVCCNKLVKKLIANSEVLGKEKHVSVVESLDGSIEHPMVEKHYIAFINILTKDYVIRKDKMCLTLPAKQ